MFPEEVRERGEILTRTDARGSGGFFISGIVQPLRADQMTVLNTELEVCGERVGGQRRKSLGRLLLGGRGREGEVYGEKERERERLRGMIGRPTDFRRYY